MFFLYDIYGMMKKCWETLPEDRPTFKELRKNTSKHLEHIAGYLEMAICQWGKDMQRGEEEQ